MASTAWKIGLSGDWYDNSNWTAGIPGSSTDVSIAAFGTYTVSLGAAAAISSLTLNAAGATFSQTAGTLSTTNAFVLNAGTAILRSANSIGSGVTQAGGLLSLSNGGALGSANYTFSGGELRAFSDITLTNEMTMSGDLTIAAAHGHTLTEDASSWSFNATDPGSIVFGKGGDDGTIVWNTVSGSITNTGNAAVEIAKGTFVGADASWGFLFEEAGKSQIDSGATLDMNGFNGGMANLRGAGSIINSGAETTLDIANGGQFSGQVVGSIALDVDTGTLTLTANQTYSGGTNITSGATLRLGSGGTTGSATGAFADGGAIVYDHSNALNITNAITGAGTVTYEGGGGVTVNRSEGYTGGTTVNGEQVTTNNGGAFGTGTLTLDNAELLGTASQTVTFGRIATKGESTVAAAHGTTLTMAPGGSFALDASGGQSTLDIGDGANDGVVVWSAGAGSTVIDIQNASLEVHAGTFRAGDSGFGFLTENMKSVAVDTGATLDMGQWSGAIAGLTGGGHVTANSSAVIDVGGGNFGGVISGVASLVVDDGLVLSGANTFTLGTTIDASSALSLGNGGTTGSITGGIEDDGTLFIDRSNAYNETETITGSGGFTQKGTGTTTINRAESYSGETDVAAGTLSIDRATAIGTGVLGVMGGEFLATSTMALSNTLHIGGTGTSTIAAAIGTTLTLSTNAWTLNATAPLNLVFGDGANNGTIIFNTGPGSSITHIGNYTLDIASGTLKAGDSSLGFLLDDGSKFTIGAAGTLDVAGFGLDAVHLMGSGHIVNSGAATTFAIENGNFAGTIANNIQILAYGAVLLNDSGYSGSITIESGSSVTLKGTGLPSVTFMDGTGTLKINNAAGVSSAVNVTAVSGDVVNGGAGNDTFNMGASLVAGVSIDGGSGTNTVGLAGDYSGGLTFGASTLQNIEVLKLGAGFDYALTMNNANVPAGHALTVDGSALGASDTLTFNGAAETDGRFIVKSGAGNDGITTGSGDDSITSGTGTDVLHGGGGNDTFIFAAGGLTAADQVDGGTGANTLGLSGDYTGAHTLTMSATTMVNVETLRLGAGDGYGITTNNATVASGATLTVNGSALGANDRLSFNGSAETNGHFKFIGGLDGDAFRGGSQSDTFVYTSAAQSTGTKYDTITDFNYSNDRFDVVHPVTAIDAGVNHTVSTASFNTDIAAAASSAHLAGHSAMLVTANAGTLSGDVFLVIDQNGTAGYQAGADLVINMHTATGTLATSDFI